MEYLFIYALQMADTVDGLKFLIFIGFCITIFLKSMTFIDNAAEEDPVIKNLSSILNKSIIVIITLFVITIIFPTKQTLILWGGTYYGKAAVNHVVNTDKYKKISELIDLKLDSLIKEERGKN